MARTHLTKNQVSYPWNNEYATAIKAKLDDFDHSVDALESGTTSTVVTIHPVRGASTANVANLASFTVANDGVTLVAGNRVLLKDQSSPAQNGIYVVGTVGGGTAALTRATDFDESAEVKPNTIIAVAAGTANGNTFWELNVAAAPTIGSTSLPFVQIFTATELASTAASKGASLIGVQDSAGHLATSNGEAVLAEIAGGALARVSPMHHVDGASTGNVGDLDAFTVANDGLTLVEGNRVLLKDQTDPAENGIYTLGAVNTGAAPLTRSLDFSGNSQLKPNVIVAVAGGTAGANTLWQLTGDFPMNIASSHKHFGQIYNATQATAAGITIAKRTVTVNDEDAGMTGASYAVNIGAALPANAIVLAHEINIVEQFAGEADTTIIIGGTDTDAIVASTDLDALAIGKYQGTLGVHPMGTFSSEQLVATFAATALEDLSAGQAIITVWYSVLA